MRGRRRPRALPCSPPRPGQAARGRCPPHREDPPHGLCPSAPAHRQDRSPHTPLTAPLLHPGLPLSPPPPPHGAQKGGKHRRAATPGLPPRTPAACGLPRTEPQGRHPPAGPRRAAAPAAARPQRRPDLLARPPVLTHSPSAPSRWWRHGGGGQ